MHLKKIFIQNFMSIGNDAISIDFDNYKDDDIVIIKGENIDVGPLASNGSGKSILSEAVSFGLFGKTIRDMEKTDDCINNLTKKGLSIEIEVDDIKVVRKRKPNKLEVYQNEENITLSSMALTQEMIEDKLRINHHTFINTFCFGQHNNYSFLSAKKADKRKIIEDILQLCEYNRYEENSRRYSRGIKSKISELTSTYERNKKEVSTKKNQLDEYEQKLKNFKLTLEKQILNTKNEIKEINSIDIESEMSLWELYEQAIKDASSVADEINKIVAKENNIRKLLLDEEKEFRNITSPIKSEIESINKDLTRINRLEEGVRCNSCYQIVDKKNYEELQKQLNDKLSKLEPELDKHIVKYKKMQVMIEQKLSEINEEKKELSNKKLSLAKTNKPLFSKESLVKKQIEKSTLENTLIEYESQLDKNPYCEIISDLKNNLSEAQCVLEENVQELKKYEELLPYYSFWVNGFGDTGVKSFVIEKIIPVLNQQINYWLQFLIDNKIIVKFDKFLNVEITRPNNLGEFTYEQGSGGEKKRIDLAITLAFAYITKLRSNSNNNLIFLDELAESIDTVDGIRRMLKELSKNYTVFLITHRPDLLSDLENKKKIIIKKENGFSTMINDKIS